MKLLSTISLAPLTIVCSVQAAFAASSLGDRAKSLTAELSSYGGLFVGLFAVVGVVMVGAGLLGLKRAQESRDSKMGPALGIIIGVALCSLAVIINMTSQSLVGSDATELGRIGIN